MTCTSRGTWRAMSTCWSAARGPSPAPARGPSTNSCAATARRSMGELLRVALAGAVKDVRVELRSRTALIAAVAFAALVLVIFNFAREPAPVSRSAMFLGKYLANVAFVFAVEAVALPLFTLFIGVDPGGALGWIALTAV